MRTPLELDQRARVSGAAWPHEPQPPAAPRAAAAAGSAASAPAQAAGRVAAMAAALAHQRRRPAGARSRRTAARSPSMSPVSISAAPGQLPQSEIRLQVRQTTLCLPRARAQLRGSARSSRRAKAAAPGRSAAARELAHLQLAVRVHGEVTLPRAAGVDVLLLDDLGLGPHEALAELAQLPHALGVRRARAPAPARGELQLAVAVRAAVDARVEQAVELEGQPQARARRRPWPPPRAGSR